MENSEDYDWSFLLPRKRKASKLRSEEQKQINLKRKKNLEAVKEILIGGELNENRNNQDIKTRTRLTKKKKKYVFLSRLQKQEIVKKYRDGHCSRELLAAEYNISLPTVHFIIHKINEFPLKPSLLDESENDKNTNCNKLNPKLETALILWINQWRSIGFPISDKLLVDKAQEFSSKIEALTGNYLKLNFSEEQLAGFKDKNQLKNLDTCKGILSNSLEKIPKFLDLLTNFIKTENYMPEQIFNCDESSLFWKMLPKNVLNLKKNWNVKIFEDRIRILFCCNASGTYKLPLLVVGKNYEERIEELPVVYEYQNEPVLNNSIFEKWLTNYFSPNVKDYLSSKNLPHKILLLLDDSLIHKISSIMQIENLKIIYFPSYAGLNIQPITQTIIPNFKQNYKRKVLVNFIQKSFKENDTVVTKDKVFSFFSRFGQYECAKALIDAWNELPENLIKSSWKKLNINLEVENNFIEEKKQLANDCKYLFNMDEIEFQKYLNQENNSSGIGDLLSDDDIIEQAIYEENDTAYKSLPYRSSKIDYKSAIDAIKTIVRYVQQEKSMFGRKIVKNAIEILEIAKCNKNRNDE